MAENHRQEVEEGTDKVEECALNYLPGENVIATSGPSADHQG